MYSANINWCFEEQGCPIFMVESQAVNNSSLSDGRLQPQTDGAELEACTSEGQAVAIRLNPTD